MLVLLIYFYLRNFVYIYELLKKKILTHKKLIRKYFISFINKINFYVLIKIYLLTKLFL